jgi:predicted nucleotide-binding protein (sugar kinase/HSP70/actin superfamily)
MGAVGCALYSKEMCKDRPSTLITAEALKDFKYTSMATQCRQCTNQCSLSVVKFNDGRRFISGNKCEKGAGIKVEHKIPNLYEYKYNKIISYENIKPEGTPIGRVGIPRVLGFYEQIPMWHKVFTDLGFEVVYSEESSRDLYYKGQHTIPSDTVCYPAKLAHGHIESILDKGVDFIFYPCISYNLNEGGSDNHYNCPVVAYYPELLKANVERLNDKNFLHPYMDLSRQKHVGKAVYGVLKDKYPQLTQKQVSNAVNDGYQALKDYQQDIIHKGEEIIKYARENGKNIIVIAGRPYHIDKEVNHGIHKLMSTLDLAVVTEDSVAHLGKLPQLEVLNQWTYHSRLYKSAQYVTTQPDMQLVQLVSFGCGIDAITTDEVRSILERNGKLYTQLKIDEISNLGAVKIRLRSLITAIEQKKKLNNR